MADLRLKDIAKKAGVSVGTVDRVIHNGGNVSAKSRAKVLAILDKFDYKPNLMARGLAKKNNVKIAALIPKSDSDPFWKLPLAGIQKAHNHVKNFGFKVDIYHYADGQEKDLLNEGLKIFKKKYQALLIAPIITDEASIIFSECEKRRIPYVQINTYIPIKSDMFLSYVGQDSYSSGKLAAKLFDFGTKAGDTLLILHLEREVYNSEHLIQKENGFRDYFKLNKRKGISIQQLTFSELESDKKKEAFVKYALSQYPKLASVFVTTSKLHYVLKEFTQYSKKPLNFIGFDLLDENLKYLNNNKVLSLINQNPIQQGYMGIMTLFNHVAHKSSVEKIQYLPIDIVMKENASFY